jgi:hypothetical protein
MAGEDLIARGAQVLRLSAARWQKRAIAVVGYSTPRVVDWRPLGSFSERSTDQFMAGGASDKCFR